MSVEIKEVFTSNEKATICENILRQLPNWFGIESSIIDYSEQTKDMPFYIATESNNPIGFVAIKNHNEHTAEVYVMGILLDYHRRGIGKKLIYCCEKYCNETKKEFLTVKTLDESRDSKSYEKTRQFYLSVGFKPLEVFPLLWDKENPCLLLVKHININTFDNEN